jgi:hypothetical protein
LRRFARPKDLLFQHAQTADPSLRSGLHLRRTVFQQPLEPMASLLNKSCIAATGLQPQASNGRQVETVLLDTPEPPAFETWLRNQRTSFSGTFGANQRWGSVKA